MLGLICLILAFDICHALVIRKFQEYQEAPQAQAAKESC